MVYIQINIEKQIISKLNDKLNLKYICNPTRNLQQKKWEIIDSFICPQLYQCLELHFHWGNTDVRGSEHTMDSTWSTWLLISSGEWGQSHLQLIFLMAWL